MQFAMLTNIIEEKTELLYVGKGAQELVRTAFKKECGENSVVLPGRSQPQKADGNAAARRDGGGSRALRPAARLHHIKQREFLTAYPPFSGEKSK